MAESCLIAQISDPHIKAGGRLSYRQVDTAGALRQAVAKLERLAPRPQLLLISGDLVDFGRPDEYAALREILAGSSLPTYLIPGNHDHRENLRAAFPALPHLFQHPRFVQWVVDDYPVRLIGLDSCVPGASHGQLCPARLQWLDATLHQQPTRPTLVMLHHHPFTSGIAHMDRQPLRDAGALAEIVAQHPQVERVLCGHLHRSLQARFANTLAMSCPGVSHQVSLRLGGAGTPSFHLEPPGYLLHHWTSAAGLVTHQGFIDDYPGPFPFYDDNGLID
ncbi:3',5'-cyclic AMP phosphodiesterase CpdA [Franzmannia pantelleriensis]|uniref:3',5'-cyclic AMP phosphodiesterase CpdA n=1 Tax=Franzmannia pantelleriensis TaxID=48727 RepID=A0A1G9WQA2_9GAMM|nr:phosphodiesterase [Halomonas pantelleriensis]SDM86658.1 3',5'-cyclic AMP phosphodiesterase CpdA [Halomonas pantelleriensis]